MAKIKFLIIMEFPFISATNLNRGNDLAVNGQSISERPSFEIFTGQKPNDKL